MIEPAADEWTVTESDTDISVTRPSPHCAVHLQGRRTAIAPDVTLTARGRQRVAEHMKALVAEASDALGHCPACGPHPFGGSGGCSGPCLDAR
jgi:hypothetical protein